MAFRGRICSRNLKKIIEAGEERALLISATGTGKTYASAFAMRELGYKRVLFLVHRGQLARQTKKSYQKIFGKNVSMGLVGAGYADYDSDYVFAMVQTLSRDEHLYKYRPDEFDCIILDEAHHSSADTYQKVMSYFKPKLWLGMTATPDKRDDDVSRRNIYEIFNYQIAYEIRLQQAMEEDILCPFHYFGISDVSLVEEKQLKSRKMTDRDFNLLTGDERVRHIVEQAEYYGYSGDRVKGLIFCSRIDESEELSQKFNALGYRTIALNGIASEYERTNAFERLAMDESDRIDNVKKQQKLIRQLEVEIRAKILKALQKTFTEDRCRDMVVAVEMDMSQRQSQSTEYKPIVIKEDNPDTPYDDSELRDTLPLSTQTVTKEWQGTGYNPEGPAGVEGQTPPVYSDMSNVIGKSTETGTTINHVQNRTDTRQILPFSLQ